MGGIAGNPRTKAAPLPEPAPFPGFVSLVSAGPGDPDLLTLAAIRAIKRADVILYDHLVGEGVLEFARRDAERISFIKCDVEGHELRLPGHH